MAVVILVVKVREPSISNLRFRINNLVGEQRQTTRQRDTDSVAGTGRSPMR